MTQELLITIMQLTRGARLTLLLWLSSSFIALGIGFLVGVLRSKRMYVPYMSHGLDFITSVLRGIPYYVQLLIAYFVLPSVLGIDMQPLSAAIVSLGFCSAAYMSQIVKGTLNALPEGQWEAAFILGYSPIQTLVYILLPQVLRVALPMLTNELDQLLKTTSIVSSIGVLELTRAGMNIIARQMNPTEVYLLIACMYLCVSWMLGFISRTIEQRITYVVR